jgi:hypothetical protein
MATTISAQQRRDLLAKIFVKWPGSSAAARAKRAAAAYLISCSSLGAVSSPVAMAVRDALNASTQQMGLPPFRQLLQQDDCFRVDNALESEAWIVLLPDRCAYSSMHTKHKASYRLVPRVELYFLSL